MLTSSGNPLQNWKHQKWEYPLRSFFAADLNFRSTEILDRPVRPSVLCHKPKWHTSQCFTYIYIYKHYLIYRKPVSDFKRALRLQGSLVLPSTLEQSLELYVSFFVSWSWYSEVSKFRGSMEFPSSREIEIPKISLGCGILAARFFPTFSFCSTKMIVAFSPRRANTKNTCACDTEA